MSKSAVRIRIRTTTDDPSAPRWIVGGARYNVARAHALAETLRRAGRVVHVDQDSWYH